MTKKELIKELEQYPDDMEMSLIMLNQLLKKRPIRICLAEDCQKIFVPRRETQIYHSETCRSKMAKRRERNRKVQ